MAGRLIFSTYHYYYYTLAVAACHHYHYHYISNYHRTESVFNNNNLRN